MVTILLIFVLQVVLIFTTKFRGNWHFGTGEVFGFPISTIIAISIYKLPRNIQRSFESIGASVKEFKIIFKMTE